MNENRSLSEVHSSVSTSHPSLWRRVFAFAGPAYLVSVGYMDPGNWATDIEGGARFGYQLLWVLVLSNAMAILLQTLSARLGIASGLDLAQACRLHYPKAVSKALWFLCELAIAACDLAELLGAAIGLNLLFGIPLIYGVLLTTLDTFLVLWFTRFGIRVMESIILAFITIIAGCFFIEIFLSKPVWSEVAGGLVPRLNFDNLYVAIGILGATVMPHNLYLHSSLVQTRRISDGDAAKRDACKFNLIDSVIALNGALLVNAAILILAAATFFKNGIVVTEIKQAHHLLEPLLGSGLAAVAFAVALLCAGQSSTITGTMAGQIVMEGFLDIRMRPWLRRLITRLVAVVPAVLTILYVGEQAVYQLLIFSQVVLSLQLPFAVIPLIRFTSDARRMGAFASPVWVKSLAWTAASIILALNGMLAWSTISGWLATSPALAYILLPVNFAVGGLLLWLIAEPWLRKTVAPTVPVVPLAKTAGLQIKLAAPPFCRILVPLDHSRLDSETLLHAASLARGPGAKLFLLHVEEGVTSLIYGSDASTAEVEEGHAYLETLRLQLVSAGLDAELIVTHGGKVSEQIVRTALAVDADLLVMGAHGHKGLKDMIFGATINEVRHAVGVPVLVVREREST
ncbi:MAG: Nramp family divalent metal transporter [Bryobacteraceae bacterium]|nr:Nramp family divalent metal transporter [Bryobacteraceae bacterium]